MKVMRFPLNSNSRQPVLAPVGAELLSVQLEDGQPVLYVVANSTKLIANNQRIIGLYKPETDIELEAGEQLQYIGAVFMTVYPQNTGRSAAVMLSEPKPETYHVFEIIKETT